MVKITRTEGLQLQAEDEQGHKIVIDTDKGFGGFEQGFRPMDLLLASIAGCMGMDIVSILQKKGGKIDTFSIEMSGIKAEKHPRRFTKITVKITCEGDYDREDLLRSYELSRDKYCSVTATLKNAPEFDFVI